MYFFVAGCVLLGVFVLSILNVLCIIKLLLISLDTRAKRERSRDVELSRTANVRTVVHEDGFS